MPNWGKFGGDKPSGARKAQFDCAAVELWLAEAAEGLVPEAIQRRLLEHSTECSACREKLERVRRGREWLQVLKKETLEPPAGIVAKILTQTSLKAGARAHSKATTGLDSSVRAGWDLTTLSHPEVFDEGHARHTAGGGGIGAGETAFAREILSRGEDGPTASGTVVPVWQQNSVVVLRRTLLEPRLALVAAMAFFSITLTLNLMGVRLTNMRLSDFQPQNLTRAMTRQYAEANARVTRYYENLRIVYEVESRVQQLRRAARSSPQPQAASGGKPHKRSSNTKGDSSDQTESHRVGIAVGSATRGKHAVAPPAVPDPRPVTIGPKLDAACHYRPMVSLWSRV